MSRTLNALKFAFGDAGDLVGTIGAGISLVAVSAGMIYEGIKDDIDAHAFQADSAKFLETGLGLNPDVAAALSAPVGRSDLPTVSAELRAYAKANGMTPAQLLIKLNGQPVNEVAQFLNIASNLAAGELVFPRGGSEHITPAEGLQMLKSWADGIFGKSQVG
jgi:hypothetical protein